MKKSSSTGSIRRNTVASSRPRVKFDATDEKQATTSTTPTSPHTPKTQKKSSSAPTSASRAEDNLGYQSLSKFSVHQLIIAFEDSLLSDDGNKNIEEITDDDWADLFTKETVRRKKGGEKKTFVGDIFRLGSARKNNDDDNPPMSPKSPHSHRSSSSNKDDEESSFSPSSAQAHAHITADSMANWKELDLAKKKRRLEAFLKRRPSYKNIITSSIVDANPEDVTSVHVVDSSRPVLIRVPCDGYQVELGVATTSYAIQLKFLRIEETDRHFPYYQTYFYDRDHYNVLGELEGLGPIIVSLEKQDKKEKKVNARVLIRTKESDEVVFVPASSKSKDLIASMKDVRPLFEKVKFKKLSSPELRSKLLNFEKNQITRQHRFGILYCREDQESDDQMFQNVEASADFENFLTFLGDKIELQGWDKYSGGLDTKFGKTGKHSIHTTHQGREIMFHVSTYLPYNAEDHQQLERKRYLGNDLVMIVFVEGNHVFTPRAVVSEMNTVFCNRQH